MTEVRVYVRGNNPLETLAVHMALGALVDTECGGNKGDRRKAKQFLKEFEGRIQVLVHQDTVEAANEMLEAV